MKKKNLIDLVILIFIFLFLLSFFEPRFLFSLTTTTGGDTASHYPTAVYLKEVLLTKGKIMGWDQGNYAGFPIFYHYFPLTFMLMVILSYLIPMSMAFKLVSVLGIFLLPVCVYFAFRLLRYQFPVPIIAATFSLAFLFMEANSMWGGNIPSTLAGEYSYGLSLALMLLFFGNIYDGIESKNKVVSNALLVFLMGLSHGYTLIFSGVISAFFLITRKAFWDNFKYLCKVFGLGALLLSFWLVPFFANLPYVTSYVTRWQIKSIFEAVPLILMPFFGLSLYSFFVNRLDRRTLYFGYVILACLILYYVGPRIGMLDIRFIPFIQLYLVIFGATFLLAFIKKIKILQLLPFIAFFAVLVWVLPNVTYIKGWVKWNYEGFESKAAWPLFQKINRHLSQTQDGRVVYEHSPQHNVFGSERAFENLPYFAGRKTLEGLYMQSSISAPFVFYIQSEVSRVCSGPFPQYKYTSLNLPAALPHLKMYNVTQYIARSPEAKRQAKTIPELRLEAVFEEYEIYGLTINDGHYVVPLNNEPVLFETRDWKKDFYEWFKVSNLNSIHLVYIQKSSEKDQARFGLKADNLNFLPRKPIRLPAYSIQEEIRDEEIIFKTDLVGFPHLIKVSYHPNWKVEGADKIYLASPSFMLVYPDQNQVRLYFGKRFYNYLGEALSLLGLSIVIISGIISIIHVRKA